MNLVLALALLGTSSVAVWAGFTDPEGGPLAGLRNVLAGQGNVKRSNVTGAAFLDSLVGTGSGGNSGGAVPTGTTTGPATGRRAAIVATAKTWIGVRYVWGGTSRSGVDCSGLTLNVYRTNGINLPRVSAAQALRGTRTNSPAPGDLVAFGAPVFHIGIVTGPDQMIHAPNSRGVVRTESISACARGMRAPVQYRNLFGSAAPTTSSNDGAVST